MSPDELRVAVAVAMGKLGKVCEHCGGEPRQPVDMQIAEEWHAKRMGELYCDNCHCGVIGSPELTLDYLNEVYEHVRKTDRALYWQLHKKLDGLVAIENSKEDSDPIATADAPVTSRAVAFLTVRGQTL